jgi:hypothetical protein
MWNLMRHSKNMENRKWKRVGGKESFTSLEIIKGTWMKTEIKKASDLAVLYCSSHAPHLSNILWV